MSMIKRPKYEGSDGEISLPEELLDNILLSMPARRVLELRCLSKYYRDLIDSPRFLNKHYDRSMKTNPSVILIDIRHRSDPFLVDYDSTTSATTVRPFNKNPIQQFNNSLPRIFTNLVGCCRGILCYRHWSSDRRSIRFSFWNPFTGAFRKNIGIHDPAYKSNPYYLFGYDAVTDDLKLVCIVRDTQKGFQYSCSVYSSKTDSWKRIAGEGLNDRQVDIDLHKDYVFVEGSNSVHTLVRDALEVLAFDFAAERFNLVPIPEKVRGANTRKLGLLSLHGFLGLYHKRCRGGWEVWKMKEYGVEESWCRVFSHKPDTYVEPGYLHLHSRALTLVNNGRQLLRMRYSKGASPVSLDSYDIEGKQHLIEPVDGLPTDYYNVRPFLFAPSLREP